MSIEDLWAIEAGFWTGPAPEAIRRLDPVALMLFGPTGILQGEAIAPTLAGAPRWDEVQMTDRHASETGDLVILAYRAKARRGGAGHEALCSSTWVRREAGWRIICHQQTPL